MTLTAPFCCSWVYFAMKVYSIVSPIDVPSVLSVIFNYTNEEQLNRKQAPERFWFTNGNRALTEAFQDTLLHLSSWEMKPRTFYAGQARYSMHAPLQLIILLLLCLFKEKRKSNTDLALCCLQKPRKSQMMQNRRDSSLFDIWKFPLFFS